MTDTPHPAQDDRLPNHLVATLALYILGGASARQNAEEVAVKCFGLAPQRFCWRRYPQYPSEIRTRVALGDAKKARYGALVEGSSQRDWILTPAGVRWCQNHLASDLGTHEAAGATQLTISARRDLAELESHAQFRRFQSGEMQPSQPEVADAVGLLPDAPPDAVRRRIADLTAAAHAAGYEEVERYLEWLTSK